MLPKKVSIIAIMALVLLPCISAASFLQAGTILAQAPPQILIPSQIADQMAGKSMAYWFIVLACVAIGSWTWIFKWLINQLELQRQAHATASNQLIEFMKNDHSATAQMLATSQATLTQTQAVLDRTVAALERVVNSCTLTPSAKV